MRKQADTKANNKAMVKTKLWLWVVFLIIISFPLSGCYDSIEIDQEVYALVIGVDKGVNNMIRVTMQVPTYKDGSGGIGNGGGGSGGGEETGEVEGTIVSTVEAPSLIEGINMLNSASYRRISLSQAKMLVFSEEYARGGVASYIEPLARYREVRELMRVVVCKGLAEDFIKENRTLIGQNIAKDIELAYLQAKSSGYFRDVFFTEFYVALLTPYGQPTAIYAGINDFRQMAEKTGQEPPLQTELDIEPGLIPRKGGSKKEMFGTAVFDGDKMVGTLSQNETRFYLMGIGEFESGFFTMEDKNKPGDIIVLEVQAVRKPRIKAGFENGVPVIDLRITLDIDMASIQSRIHYEKLDKINELESYIEAYFVEGIKKTIEKTQQQWNTDIFHFGKKMAGSFRTIQEMEGYNWLSHYQEAEVNVQVQAKIRRSGYFFGTRHIFSSKANLPESQ